MALEQSAEYVSNPALETVLSGYPGNRRSGGRYMNDVPHKFPGFPQVLRWQFTPNPQRTARKNDSFRVKVHYGDSFVGSDQDMIVWLGHASFFMRLDGVTFITDPCLTAPPMVKRLSDLPCGVHKLRGLDYLLMSHAHLDHFDVTSLKKLFKVNPDLHSLMPLGMTDMMQGVGGQVMQEAGWFQRYNLTPDIQITFLPAIHWYRRTLTDFNRVLWGSFMVRTRRHTVYFAGDTAYGPHFQQIRQAMGSPGVCLMPVGAYRPQYIMKGSHTNPYQAIKAFHDLGGGRFVPMHYGTFSLSDEPPGEPVRMLGSVFGDSPVYTPLDVGQVMAL